MRRAIPMVLAVLVLAGGCNRRQAVSANAGSQYSERAQAPRDALYRLKTDMETGVTPETFAAHLSDAKVSVDRFQRGLSPADKQRTSAKAMPDTLTYFEVYANAVKYERETREWVSREAAGTDGIEKANSAHATWVAEIDQGRDKALKKLTALDKTLDAGN